MKEHELLPYYLRELTALKDLGKRFGQIYPHIAEHLQYEHGFKQNPQLAQLIEAQAFLNARVSYQLDQDYPQILSQLIESLYPHLAAPVPAMAIVQWPETKQLEKSITIPRGTLIETDPNAENSCRFSTCYEIKVQPIALSEASLTTALNNCPGQGAKKAQSVLQLTLHCANPKLALMNLGLKNLDFYLRGEHGLAYLLHETLLTHCQEVVIAEQHRSHTVTHWRSPSLLQGLGFAPEQAILPQDPRTAAGQRWLAEFFALPEKFLFLRINELPVLSPGCEQLQFYFYLDTKPDALLHKITTDNFQLGCTPIVNLFPKTVEPLELDYQQAEYPIITDIRRPQDYEIYRVQRIYSMGAANTINHYQPLFLPAEQAKANWQVRRVSCEHLAECHYPGTELLLRVIKQDNDFTSDTLVIETLASNRHLPQLLQQQSPLPVLQPVLGNLPPLPIHWQHGLSQARPALLQLQNQFLLLLHLIPGLLSYTTDQAQQLRQLLQIYLQPHQQHLRRLLESIVDLKNEPCAALLHQHGQYGYCQGNKLTLLLDQAPIEAESWLFFSILERFLGEQSPINSFIQLAVKTTTEEVYQWPMQLGNRPLI